MSQIEWKTIEIGAWQSWTFLTLFLPRPPHGEASPESLKRVAPVVASTLDRLAKCGFTVVSLTAGQGLVDHATAIEAHLKRASPDHRAVVVIPAIATATSENHGVAVF